MNPFLPFSLNKTTTAIFCYPQKNVEMITRGKVIPACREVCNVVQIGKNQHQHQMGFSLFFKENNSNSFDMTRVKISFPGKVVKRVQITA